MGLCVLAASLLLAVGSQQAQRTLTFEERVQAQAAIERVYYAHQIGATTPFELAVPRAVLESKVRTYLDRTKALELQWDAAAIDRMLEHELQRMATSTRMPERLQELYAALDNNPFLIKECLARANLGNRSTPTPDLPVTGAPDDSWEPVSSTGPPAPRGYHTAVWTGSLMIVWGGYGNDYLNTGGRYDPATDTWTPTSTVNAPSARCFHSAVWTGARMIVWGGAGPELVNSGGRYDPASDTWTPTTTANAPSARQLHTAIWTGGLMIVWGGWDGTSSFVGTGDRYDPATDTWTPTATSNAPPARYSHTAVWTGHLMIVWGGTCTGDGCQFLRGGGRYDPATDSWTPASSTDPPRRNHTAIWTGSVMVVWGGYSGASAVNTGGRYDPATDTWTPTSSVNAPTARHDHTADWTGCLLVVWGGATGSTAINTGGRYDPATDAWTATSTTGAPSARYSHSAVSAGDLTIVWGGFSESTNTATNTGGQYALGQVASTWYRDLDADGFGDAANHVTVASCAGPPGYVLDGRDCDDDSSAVHPGATELCNGVDDNCSGQPDEGLSQIHYRDADGDGFGDPNVTLSTCASLPGWVLQAGDCDDSRAIVHPGAAELCDGLDNNCNGQVDENASGVDGDGDGVHNACDNCGLVFNPDQLDSDGDGIGNACDNCIATANPGQQDLDADQRGDPCDNCPSAYNPFQDDSDADRCGDACDNCIFDFNPAQSDVDHDGQGDICDLNDGLIYVYATDKDYREWQAEVGYTPWNSYRGSLAVLRATGQYTQAPGSSPLAGRACGLNTAYVFDSLVPNPGEVAFNLVTGLAGGVESGLGANSAGVPRANTHPCP